MADKILYINNLSAIFVLTDIYCFVRVVPFLKIASSPEPVFFVIELLIDESIAQSGRISHSIHLKAKTADTNK
ncbi:MAG: hypothetical protein NTY07_12325 [Bacteroidia bacterium]|nr:hypothetical protein [Bacteroidia bacterium]